MDLGALIEALSQPDAYPHPAPAIEVHQTHISVVFLAGEFAYKIKKPVEMGFLDYRTVDLRQHFCEEEVRLNRRLATEVYLGVVPINLSGNRVCVSGAGPVIEWAVKMVRLPADATFAASLRAGTLTSADLERLASCLADFHAKAESGPHISHSARFDVVETHVHENLAAAGPGLGLTISRTVLERLEALTKATLAEQHDLIETRSSNLVARDTHGDLRLGHVYLRPERSPPNDLVVVDCIEFNESYRHADPVSDVAFLAMELQSRGRRDLARVFTEAYFQASGDDEGRALLPLYIAYRGAVRGKVASLTAHEPEVGTEERVDAIREGRACWLTALGSLEWLSKTPCVVLVGGLPGSGKSTLSREISRIAGFTVVRSDEVRKELAALEAITDTASPFGEGVYTREWDHRTYAECLRRAEAIVFEGRRALIDASFREDSRRTDFLQAADSWGVPGAIMICKATDDVIRSRLANRRNDASDADWDIYRRVSAVWEPPGPRSSRSLRVIDSSQSPEVAVATALDALRDWGLFHTESDPA